MTTNPAVSISSLTKSYGSKQVLRGLDLQVPTGGVLALLGPNGAGKTTTVEILQGLRRRDGGSVAVLGEDPQRSSRAWRARIGVVSQASTDMGDLTVNEAVSHVARFYTEPADVAATIGRVGLADDAALRSRLDPDLLAADEQRFQDLWRTYFRSLTIRERLNPRKQRQDMPVRFWPHLTEMQPEDL